MWCVFMSVHKSLGFFLKVMKTQDLAFPPETEQDVR